MSSEADYMYQAQLAQLGAEFDDPDPEFEVVDSSNNRRLFSGTRAECWGYKRSRGGYVRPWSGHDD